MVAVQGGTSDRIIKAVMYNQGNVFNNNTYVGMELHVLEHQPPHLLLGVEDNSLQLGTQEALSAPEEAAVGGGLRGSTTCLAA
jgi:hypothetical protein